MCRVVNWTHVHSIFYDKDPPGWLTWGKTVELYTLPDSTRSTFQPWDPSSGEAVSSVAKITTDQTFWEKLSTYYAEENHESAMIQDNVSCVKSICMSRFNCPRHQCGSKCIVQLLEDKPFAVFKPVVEKLIADKDQNKQRAAAELLAGILGGMSLCVRNGNFLMLVNAGSKHWPTKKQQTLWAWFAPHMKKIFSQNIKTDTLPIWSSFIEVCDIQ